jgi:ribosomal protein S6
MPRPLSEKQQQEFTKLEARCESFVAFMRARSDASDPASAALLEGVGTEIQKAVSAHDLVGLRELAKEINRWLKALPPQMQREFESQAPTELVGDVKTEREREIDRIRDFRRRGSLADEDEYRLVLDRVEEIYADPSHSGEVEELNRLLNTFERGQQQRKS